ncbi:hypothetical protein Tco_0409372 [Tanacetum coccineum]
MVAYLEKSPGSAGFHQIIDFINRSHICYALSKKPEVCVSFIKQFWRTAEIATNEDVHVIFVPTQSLSQVKKLDSQIKVGKSKRHSRSTPTEIIHSKRAVRKRLVRRLVLLRKEKDIGLKTIKRGAKTQIARDAEIARTNGKKKERKEAMDEAKTDKGNLTLERPTVI